MPMRKGVGYSFELFLVAMKVPPLSLTCFVLAYIMSRLSEVTCEAEVKLLSTMLPC